MRSGARILHLDLDAFFAAVEQRDKPSLRGKPVVVGGAGPRGVVATASYEARVFGVRSAMPGTEARRRCPHAAFLGGRFAAYRQSSEVVMQLLTEISPAVEPLSLDEAFVDLALSDWDPAHMADHVEELRRELARRTAGLTASVGVASSKFVAKIASEAAKPDGFSIVEEDEELDFIAELPVRSVPGVGPVTEAKLTAIGMRTVADLRRASREELVRELGRAAGESLMELAFARDNRRVQSEREAKSISTEDTFAVNIVDRSELERILRRDAAQVAKRVQQAGVFARTVAVKVRFADFTTISKARSLGGATDREESIAAAAVELLAEVDVREGVRLVGVSTSNFAASAQERLFDEDRQASEPTTTTSEVDVSGVRGHGWFPGAEVFHRDHGRGWVWGAGLGRVTIRFENRDSSPGPVRTFRVDDPALMANPELLPLP